MGGILSSGNAPIADNEGPDVHVPRKRKMSGKPAVGSFSAGATTMNKMRTRSDFCLLKIFQEEVVKRAFDIWTTDEMCNDGSLYLKFITCVNEMKAAPDTSSKRVKMMEIFTKFISQASKTKIPLDSATRETIVLGFENKVADENIFDLSYEKAYQVSILFFLGSSSCYRQSRYYHA